MSFSLSEYTIRMLDPTGGAYSAPQGPPAGFKGATSRQEGNGGKEREGLGGGGRGKGREEKKGKLGE